MARRNPSRQRKRRAVYLIHWVFELSASVTALVMGHRQRFRSRESRACMVGAISRRVFGGEGETASTWRSGASAKRQAGLLWRVKAALRLEDCASRPNGRTWSMSRQLIHSVAPIVEGVELSVNRRAALVSCLFEVSDGPRNVRVAHVSRRVIVLVHGEDAGVALVQVVKSLKVRGVLRDDGEAVCGGEAKVDVVILAAQAYFIIGRANHPMPTLSEEIGQEVGIRAVVKIQVEGHGQPLPA